VFTDFPDARTKLLADVPAAKADARIVGLPDPDVTILRIDIAVGGLEFDPANQFERGVPVLPLYTTSRPFPADPTMPLNLEFDFIDVPDIAAFPAPGAAGPLSLPASRDVYLTDGSDDDCIRISGSRAGTFARPATAQSGGSETRLFRVRRGANRHAFHSAGSGRSVA
jgi:hypothetical protein